MTANAKQQQQQHCIIASAGRTRSRAPPHLSDELGAHGHAEVVHEGLGAAVHVAAGERVVPRHAANVHHVAVLALDHAWQHGFSHVQEALAVHVDHLIPVVHGPVREVRRTKRQPCVVHEHANVRELGGEALDCGGYAQPVAHVNRQGVDFAAVAEGGDFVHKGLQQLRAAAHCDDTGAGLRGRISVADAPREIRRGSN